MPPQMPHEKILNHLIQHIFTRKLKPGDKLPTVRHLSSEMNVDQASVRIAFKQLEIMKVVQVKRGDGAYVKDYMKNAGIDFLSASILPQPKDNEKIVDEYLVDELWEFWISVLPEILKLAAEKHSPRDLRELMRLLDEQLKHIQDRKKVVELQVETQDFIAQIANNIMFMLLFNSSRPLRIKMTELFITNIEEDTLRQNIEVERTMLKNFMIESPQNTRLATENVRELISGYRELMRHIFHKKTMQS